MPYTIEFASGHKATISVRGRAPDYLIGVARDQRGYARTVFFREDGRMQQVDPWVARIHAEAAKAYELRQLEPAPKPVGVVA